MIGYFLDNFMCPDSLPLSLLNLGADMAFSLSHWIKRDILYILELVYMHDECEIWYSEYVFSAADYNSFYHRTNKYHKTGAFPYIILPVVTSAIIRYTPPM